MHSRIDKNYLACSGALLLWMWDVSRLYRGASHHVIQVDYLGIYTDVRDPDGGNHAYRCPKPYTAYDVSTVYGRVV